MTIKIAVISTALPPSGSGQAIALHRLLRDRSARYWYFSDDPASFEFTPQSSWATYTRLRPLLFGVSMRNYPGPIGSLNAHVGAMRPVNIRAREILGRLGDAKPDLVIGCSGNPFDLPAASVVAAQLSIPLIAWLFDDPVLQWPVGTTRNIVRRLERDWSSKARYIVCPNENLAATVASRSRRTPIIVRNPRDDASTWKGGELPVIAAGRPIRIVYSGAVANTHADALANLVDALRHKNGRYELHIFSRQTDRQLAAMGVSGQHVYLHDYLDNNGIVDQQRNADILFLPLAFRSPIQGAVMSASPGKMGEYLASGRPILVHAPKGSFVTEFMRAHRAARIVDTPSRDLLVAAIDELVENADLRRSVILAASKTSKLFAENVAREAFWNLVEPS